MSLPTTEAKRVHNLLLVRLDKTFDSESVTFRELKRVARAYLYAGQVDRCHSMHDLLEALQGRGDIKVGEYSKLKLMMEDAECEGNEALLMIKEAEEDIHKSQASFDAKKRHQSSQETSLESETNGGSAEKRRKRKLSRSTNSPTTVEKQVSGSQPSPCPEMKTSYGKGKGYCLIINNFKEERKGVEQDKRRLKSFLESVNCVVQVCGRQDALRRLEGCENVLKTRYAYFICIIMSHGNQDGIQTTDGQRITMEDLMTRFTDDKLPFFVGKPKIFLVQACWGPSDQSAHAVANDDKVSDLVEEVMRLPKNADILLAHATTPGYRAWRISEGSWFFQSLLDILERHHNTEHLEDMLTCLRGVITTQRQTGDGIKQVPCTYSTLTKCFYF